MTLSAQRFALNFLGGIFYITVSDNTNHHNNVIIT